VGPPIRPDLAGRSPYGAPQLDVPVRLNTNENPFPPPPVLVQAITDAVAGVAGSLNRYPDRDAMALRAELAAYLGHGLTARQVWAANGSNEIIQQLLQVFGGHGRSALGFEPSYAMHPLISRATGTRWISGAREDDFGLDAGRTVHAVREHQPDLVFLTSPNNPTGTGLPLAVIEAVCEAAPGMVVVDEAYAEFAREGTETALALLPRFPRLVVTRRGPRSRTPTACSPPWPTCAPSGTAWWTGCAGAGSPRRTRTPTSSCSAGSATRTRSGRACWTVACSSARSARPAGCG
jgi:histidinol-phosphate aminotransferase